MTGLFESTAKDSPRVDARLLALASFAAALGYLLLPTGADLSHPIRVVIPILRWAVAGCISGLLVAPPFAPWWGPAATTAVGGSLGAVAVALTTRSSGLSLRQSAEALVVGLVVGCLVSLVLSQVRSRSALAAQGLGVAIVVVIALGFSGVVPGVVTRAGFQSRQTQLAVHPQPEKYAMDGWDFLRTYDLMKQGQGYYVAFRQGLTDDSRHDSTYITSPFNYREPFVFYLWQVLPGNNGAAVWDWFVVYAALVLICSYVLASTLVAPGAALLAPVALIPFFSYFFWVSSWFAITEVWAAGFAVAAVMCLVRRWWVPSLLLLTAAVAAREFMVLLIAAWLLAWWFSGARRRAMWWLPASAILGPVAVLAAHFLAVPATLGGAGSIAMWLHGGPNRLVAALVFGYRQMPAGKWIALGIGGAAVVSAAVARPRWREAALLAATIIPTLFLLAISAGQWHYYWGAFYTPLAASIAPGVLGTLLPPESGGEPGPPEAPAS